MLGKTRVIKSESDWLRGRREFSRPAGEHHKSKFSCWISILLVSKLTYPPHSSIFCASAVFFIVSFSRQGRYEKNGQTDEAWTRINGCVGVLDDSTRDILLPLSLEFVFTCSLYATNEKRKKFRPNFLSGNKESGYGDKKLEKTTVNTTLTQLWWWKEIKT